MLTVFYSELPPSSNKIYYNRPGGGRGLTNEADRYKKRFIRWFTGKLMQKGLTSFSDEVAYELRLLLVLPEIVNTTWPKEARTRWKKVDPDNRVKLILDAISKTIGVDDAAFFSVTSIKCGGMDTGVGILIRQLHGEGEIGSMLPLFLGSSATKELDDFCLEIVGEYMRR